jgi:hypothetical protein
MSDVPLLEPRVDQGIFLLKFVQPSQKQSPHLELVELSSLKTSALVKKTIQDNSGGYGWIPESLPGYGVMSLSYNPKPERRGGYPIQFQITGRPDDWSTRKIVKQTATGTETRFVNPSKVWVEGWVNVSAP